MNLDEYQLQAIRTAIYPGRGTPLGLIYCALKMNGEAGEFAEHVGKAVRDDNLVEITRMFGSGEATFQTLGTNAALTPERRNLLIKEIGDVLWYLAAAADELGLELSVIAQENLAKLADRKARGVLGGSGDVR